MISTNQQTFEIVRRGYDVDQVDEFLITQALAWRGELDSADRRVAELEQELVRLGHLEAEVEQARQQQQAVSLALQTAAEIRDKMLAETRTEIADLRAVTEAELGKAGIESAAEADRLGVEAEEQATALVEAAKQSAAEVEEQARAYSNELAQAHEEEYSRRREDADERHAATMARYEEAERVQESKVNELNSIRETLVVSLEAIASGGLAAMGEFKALMAPVGVLEKVADATDASPDARAAEEETADG